MGGEEFGLRAWVYEGWLAGAGEFRGRLGVLADYLGERDHPEAAACRADWRPGNNRAADPGGWWRWRVATPAARDWDVRKAFLRGTKHNGRLWLCWPAGWVRVTGGVLLRDGYEPIWVGPGGVDLTTSAKTTYHTDGWTLTVTPHQTRYSTPAENGLPLGWTALFHPPARCPLSPAERDRRATREAATPDLFSEVF